MLESVVLLSFAECNDCLNPGLKKSKTKYKPNNSFKAKQRLRELVRSSPTDLKPQCKCQSARGSD